MRPGLFSRRRRPSFPQNYRQAAVFALLIPGAPILVAIVGALISGGLEWRMVGIQILIWAFVFALLFIAAVGGIDPDRRR